MQDDFFIFKKFNLIFYIFKVNQNNLMVVSNFEKWFKLFFIDSRHKIYFIKFIYIKNYITKLMFKLKMTINMIKKCVKN